MPQSSTTNLMIKSVLLLLFYLGSSETTLAQEKNRFSHFIELRTHAGTNYYPGGELEDELDDGYYGADVRFGWQPYEYDSWAGLLNYPNYGVGYWVGNVGNPDIFGTPMSVYGFINFPIYRTKNIEFTIGPALGMAFNLKPYHPVTNQQNELTGGTIAAFFNPSISSAFKLSESLDFKAEANFIHMSNGGVRQPNTGFDMFGFNLGLRYHIDRKNKFGETNYNTIFDEKRPKRTESSSSVNLFQAFGINQIFNDKGTDTDYIVSTTVLEYQHQFNEIHGMTAGFNLFVDQSVKPHERFDEFQTTAFPAVHVGYDLHFWVLAIRQQFGIMLTEPGFELKAGFFMRLGLTADITKSLYFQIAVKSIQGFKADWTDFGVGVRLFKR